MAEEDVNPFEDPAFIEWKEREKCKIADYRKMSRAQLLELLLWQDFHGVRMHALLDGVHAQAQERERAARHAGALAQALPNSAALILRHKQSEGRKKATEASVKKKKAKAEQNRQNLGAAITSLFESGKRPALAWTVDRIFAELVNTRRTYGYAEATVKKEISAKRSEVRKSAR